MRNDSITPRVRVRAHTPVCPHKLVRGRCMNAFMAQPSLGGCSTAPASTVFGVCQHPPWAGLLLSVNIGQLLAAERVLGSGVCQCSKPYLFSHARLIARRRGAQTPDLDLGEQSRRASASQSLGQGSPVLLNFRRDGNGPRHRPAPRARKGEPGVA